MRALIVVTLLGFTSYAVTVAAVPLWAVQGGTSPGAAGLATTVMLAGTVVLQTCVPWLVDRLGIGAVLALGLLALGAPGPLYLLSDDLSWVLAVSVVRGGGFGILTVVGSTLTVRIAPAARHGQSVGIYGLAVAVPNVAGISGGVALTASGHFGVVAVLSAAPVLAIPFTRWLRVPGAATPTRGTGPTLAAVLTPTLVLLAVTFAGGGLVTALPIERPDGLVAAVALFLCGVFSAISRWGAGTLADRHGAATLLPAALGTGIAGMLLVAAGLLTGGTGGVALILIGAAVFGLCYGSVQNLTLVLAIARAGHARAATASAAWNAGFDAGTAVGAFAVGWIAATGPGLSWTLAGCAALLAVTLAPAYRASRWASQVSASG